MTRRRGIHDQVDGVGQPLPSLGIQPEVLLALVADDDLQVRGSQPPVMPQELGVTAVERFVQPITGGGSVLGPHQADHVAVDEVHPLEPFKSQVAAEEPGRAGQKDCPHLGARSRQCGSSSQRRGVDELVQGQVTGMHL